MRAVVCREFGDVDVLELREVPAPKRVPGYVTVSVRASGVNRADLSQRRGHYPPPPGASEILGLEVAGEVIEADPEAAWRPGDRVMALLPGGGYAEKAVVASGALLPIPDGFSFVEGAAVMEAFLTAHHNVFTLGGLAAGEVALIHAGASGVGTSAIQMVRAIGARVFCTVGGAEKAAACARLGAESILYRETEFAGAIAAATGGKGANVILDCVGGGYLQGNIEALAIEGRLICIGLLGGRQGTLDLDHVLMKRVRIFGSTLRALPDVRKAEIVARFDAAFGPALKERRVHPIVDRTFPIAEVREAHRYVQANLNIGKVVLTWD